MHRRPRAARFALVTLTTAAVADAEAGAHPVAQSGTQAAAPPVKESKPGLLRRAAVASDPTTRTAMQPVPNDEIEEAEIEQETGRLVYSYDVKLPGKPDVDEMLVDSQTGAVVSHTHESAAAESRWNGRAAKARTSDGMSPLR